MLRIDENALRSQHRLFLPQAQKVFNEWRKEERSTMVFGEKIPSDFFTLPMHLPWHALEK
jgi:hypothetical protein